MNQDKKLDKSSVQARTPGGSSVKLGNQGRMSENDTNGKKERKRVALGGLWFGEQEAGLNRERKVDGKARNAQKRPT